MSSLCVRRSCRLSATACAVEMPPSASAQSTRGSNPQSTPAIGPPSGIADRPGLQALASVEVQQVGLVGDVLDATRRLGTSYNHDHPPTRRFAVRAHGPEGADMETLAIDDAQSEHMTAVLAGCPLFRALKP